MTKILRVAKALTYLPDKKKKKKKKEKMKKMKKKKTN